MGVRHVRTEAGVKKYGLPIGSPIVPGAARAKMAAGAVKAAAGNPAKAAAAPGSGSKAGPAAELHALADRLDASPEGRVKSGFSTKGDNEIVRDLANDVDAGRLAPARAAAVIERMAFGKAHMGASASDASRALTETATKLRPHLEAEHAAQAGAHKEIHVPHQTPSKTGTLGTLEATAALRQQRLAAGIAHQPVTTPARPASAPAGPPILHRMIDADSSARAWSLADSLKGKELTSAVAAIPAGYRSGLTSKATATEKRRALVTWARSTDQINSEALRGVGQSPEHMARVRSDERARRHAELAAPSSSPRRASDVMKGR